MNVYATSIKIAKCAEGTYKSSFLPLAKTYGQLSNDNCNFWMLLAVAFYL